MLEWSTSEGLLVVTHSKNMNHGIKKFSALNPEHAKYIELHTKPVRDIRFSPNNDGIIMSVSLDKTLKLTSTKTENVVLSYPFFPPKFLYGLNFLPMV